jgi:CspA family cold shock protein
MSTGTVKWFDNRKGYGFILAAEDGEDVRDVFVHYTKIQMDGFKKLETGDTVSYTRFIDEKGRPQADEVAMVEGVKSDVQV